MKMLDTTIGRELNDVIERELQKGESVSFIETPLPRFFDAETTAIFLFAIPWNLLALWMLSGFKVFDFQSVFNLLPLVLVIPYLLIGFAMLSTPIWKYRSALKSAYVITDRRAITFECQFRTTIQSYCPDDLDDLYRTERSDGSGDVFIKSMTGRDSGGRNLNAPIGFFDVANAKATEDRLRELASSGE